MNLTLIAGGSKSITVESVLSWLFPPRITSLDRDGLKDSLEYQYRITRRGEDKNPEALMGVRIVRVHESRARFVPKSGTREARRFSMCA